MQIVGSREPFPVGPLTATPTSPVGPLIATPTSKRALFLLSSSYKRDIVKKHKSGQTNYTCQCHRSWACDAVAYPRTFFGQNLGTFRQIRAKVIKIWVNLIRFGQNQNLASPKTLTLLRQWYLQMHNQNTWHILQKIQTGLDGSRSIQTVDKKLKSRAGDYDD